MAPSHSRQLLVWSLPTIAALLSYIWFKKKRCIAAASSKSGEEDVEKVIEDKSSRETEALLSVEQQTSDKQNITQSLNIASSASEVTTPVGIKSFSRSLSGVESTPIDIITPNNSFRGRKANKVIISDEDLDFEIEKIKSMRYSGSVMANAIEPKADLIKATIEDKNVEKTPTSSTSTSPLEPSPPETEPLKTETTQTVMIEQEETKPENTVEENAEKSIEEVIEKVPTPVEQKPVVTGDKKQDETAATLQKIEEKISVEDVKPDKSNGTTKSQQAAPKNRKKKFTPITLTSINNNGSTNGREKGGGRRSGRYGRKIDERKTMEDFLQKKHTGSGGGGGVGNGTAKSNNVLKGRDSANHSPTDPMLVASPSLSSISDNHSEGSNDSGKGGSDVVTPPPSRTTTDGSVTVLATNNTLVCYDFYLPMNIIGKLIGRNGSQISEIKSLTNARISLLKVDKHRKRCLVEGTETEVNCALKVIRDIFPLKKYPEITLEQISRIEDMSPIPMMPDNLYLKLVENVSNDTILSCLVAPNHLFLQQPTHPSYPYLNTLSGSMNSCYQDTESPFLPETVPENSICAAFYFNYWYRAMLLETDTGTNNCSIKLLDYGGYYNVPFENLRQIRGDFLLTPFQAAECILANVVPSGGVWSEEAFGFVHEITRSYLICTQIVDYTEEGIPLVYCHIQISPNQQIFLNQELVNNGFAEWVNTSEEVAATINSSNSIIGVENNTVIIEDQLALEGATASLATMNVA